MPVSASQHRATTGAYQNKLHKDFRRNIPQIQGINPDGSAIPEEILRVGRHINQMLNSPEELNRSADQRSASRQGIIAPLLLLLSQIRLADNPAASLPANATTPSVSENAGHPDHPNNGFGALLSPVANALYETGQFISRHDPLRFPVAAASPLPSAETEPLSAVGVIRDRKSDSYTITDEQKKSDLISAITEYLVSDGQLTADDSKDFKLWLRSEAAGMPVLIARLDNNDDTSNRTRRALAAGSDPRTAEHIKQHCAFEEEVLNTRGENAGKLLLFQAQRAENPFRMIYDNEDTPPSSLVRKITDAANFVVNLFTLGMKPLIGKLIANARRQKYYQNRGDAICAERFRRLNFAELFTSLDISGRRYATRGATKVVKPVELRHVSSAPKRAAFYTQNPATGIRKEILLELDEGKGVKDNNGNIIYLKPTDKPNEFLTYHPDSVRPELLEKRVIVDENNLSWRYADSADSSELNVNIREGEMRIKLYDDYYNLHRSDSGQYEIIVKTESGINQHFPVYMEPFSRTWHLNIHNGQPVFSSQQQKIINKIRVDHDVPPDDYSYLPTLNPSRYGTGKIIEVTDGKVKFFFIEMGGEYIPVRYTKHKTHGILYNAYDMKHPEKKGYLIEWDGERWLFKSSWQPVMALIPGTETKVPVRYVCKVGTQKIYIRLTPSTGEKPRERYFINKGVLQPVPGYSPERKNNLVRLCSARTKRGIDEVCTSIVPFGKELKNHVLDVSIITDNKPSLAFLYPHLKRINPVRYEILEHGMINAGRISSAAENKIQTLTDEEIISSFEKYTNVRIYPEMVEAVRKKVRETNKAIDFYFGEKEERILLSMGYNKKDFTAAHVHLEEKYFILIFENFFKVLNSPANVYRILIHEASHAAETADYFYYYLLPPSRRGILKSGDKEKNINKYIKATQSYQHNREPGEMNPGPSLAEKLNVSPDIGSLNLNKVLINRLAADKKLASEISINNADTIAAYIMGVGTENSKLKLEKINSLLTDEKRKLAFSAKKISAYLAAKRSTA